MTDSQLVPVVPGTIGNVQCLTVDGRTLHSILGVRRVFAAWIQGRIEKYGFVQGQDFEVFSNSGKNSEGGRPSQEYTCTLDMGKELCMVENNEKGRIARRYFIECERRLLSAEPFGNSEQLTSPLSRRTDPERKALTAIINTWVGMAPIHYAAARAQVNAHFGVAGVDKLTVAQVKEAIQWVQAKIDALPPAPEQLALPSHSMVLDEQAQKVQSLMDEVKQQGNEFMSSIFTLQSALRFRLIKMNPAVPDLSKALERTLPQFVTAIGMNISALSDLLDVYSTTLAATE